MRTARASIAEYTGSTVIVERVSPGIVL